MEDGGVGLGKIIMFYLMGVPRLRNQLKRESLPAPSTHTLHQALAIIIIGMRGGEMVENCNLMRLFIIINDKDAHCAFTTSSEHREAREAAATHTVTQAQRVHERVFGRKL